MLNEIHAHCTAMQPVDKTTMCIPFTRISDSLREQVVRVAMRLSQREPVVRHMYYAFMAIDGVAKERYETIEAVLVRYGDLIEIHLVHLCEATADLDAYVAARLLLVCFAHSTFEASHSFMTILADEAICAKQAKPSILDVYHATWSAVCDNAIPDVINVLS